MTRHVISHADDLFFGAAQYGPYQNALRGIAFNPETFVDLGAPIVADTDAFIAAATSTELPNATSISYDFPGTASPTDNAAGQSGEIATPRNVTMTVTHASSIVAMSALIHGRDVYGDLMTEQLSVTATGTSKTATGLKAFKSIHRITFTSAGDATANTANVGFGSALGLPFRINSKMRISAVYESGALEVGTLGTPVVADDNTPTATTGDVRGTYTTSDTLDGSAAFALMLRIDPTSKENAFGNDNYYSGPLSQ